MVPAGSSALRAEGGTAFEAGVFLRPIRGG